VKQLAIFMLAALPLLTPTLMGQEAKKVQEPEYGGVFFYLDPAGALTPLERQQPAEGLRMKMRGPLGILGPAGGGESVLIFKGAHSAVRFKAGQEIQFVIRLDLPGVEPCSLVNLGMLQVAKNERSIVLEDGCSTTGYSADTRSPNLRHPNFSKYGEGSLKLSPAEPLVPGEYLLVSMVGRGFFLFGVDPK
jgi:hypothetical protein